MILSILSITLIAILAVHLDNSSLSGMVSRPDLIRLPQKTADASLAAHTA